MYQINYEDDLITYNNIDDALLDLNKVLSNTENKNIIEFSVLTDLNTIKFSKPLIYCTELTKLSTNCCDSQLLIEKHAIQTKH